MPTRQSMPKLCEYCPNFLLHTVPGNHFKAAGGHSATGGERTTGARYPKAWRRGLETTKSPEKAEPECPVPLPVILLWGRSLAWEKEISTYLIISYLFNKADFEHN